MSALNEYFARVWTEGDLPLVDGNPPDVASDLPVSGPEPGRPREYWPWFLLSVIVGSLCGVTGFPADGQPDWLNVVLGWLATLLFWGLVGVLREAGKRRKEQA